MDAQEGNSIATDAWNHSLCCSVAKSPGPEHAWHVGDVGHVLLFVWQKTVLQAPGLDVSAAAGYHQENPAAAHLDLELE